MMQRHAWLIVLAVITFAPVTGAQEVDASCLFAVEPYASGHDYARQGDVCEGFVGHGVAGMELSLVAYMAGSGLVVNEVLPTNVSLTRCDTEVDGDTNIQLVAFSSQHAFRNYQLTRSANGGSTTTWSLARAFDPTGVRRPGLVAALVQPSSQGASRPRSLPATFESSCSRTRTFVFLSCVPVRDVVLYLRDDPSHAPIGRADRATYSPRVPILYTVEIGNRRGPATVAFEAPYDSSCAAEDCDTVYDAYDIVW